MESIVTEKLSDHIPHIRRIIRKIVNNSNLIDDIEQECCVNIIECEHMWSGDESTLKQWMNAIARYTSYKKLRELKKNQQKQSPISEDMCVVNTENDKPCNFSEKQIVWVCEQFERLTEKQKKILSLRYIKGMKFREISDELGISLQAVDKNLRRSILRIKRRARAQGMLVLLLPWRWNFKAVSDLIMANKFTEVASVLIVLALIGVGGYQILFSLPTNEATLSTASSNPHEHLVQTQRYEKANGIVTSKIVNPFERGLVGHWTFDGSVVRDITGQSKNATLGAGTFLKDGVLYADNKGPQVTIAKPSPQLNKMSALTLSCWIKVDSDLDGALIDKTIGGKTNTQMMLLYHGTEGNGGAKHKDKKPGKRKLIFKLFDGPRYDDSHVVFSDKSVNEGEWCHVVGTWDGSVMKMYVNGQLQSHQPLFKGVLNQGKGELYFGAIGDNLRKSSFEYILNGQMDDVRIYHRALSQVEVMYFWEKRQ